MKGNDRDTNISKSELKRANLMSHYFKKAYEKDARVVYVNSFVPCEIFWALDFIPFNLGTIGGILSQGKASTKFINTAQQNHYSSDLCSTSRCIVGAALANALPTPDFVVITSAPCDVGSNIYYFLGQHYKKEWFLLDVPYYFSDETVTHLENQVKNMIVSIENSFNIKLDPEKLKTVIHYSNEASTYLEKISELTKMIPSPLSASESMEIASSLHLMGTREMAEICKERYEEINRKTQDKNNQDKKTGDRRKPRKPRILWHGLRPYYTDDIFHHLENKCQLEIISEINLNWGSSFHLNMIDPEKPYQSLAEKLTGMIGSFSSNSPYAGQHISSSMKEYSLDGVISFNSRGCRHMLGIHQVLRDTANKNDLPYLEIDGDYIDDRDFSFEQIKTRIDAFAELLHGRIK